jgi:NADH-quinone oxidoreductase subunit I
MYGIGLVKGLGLTLRHFVESYTDDVRYLFRGGRYRQEYVMERQAHKAIGIYTVQYPDERLPMPENFRFIPFLVMDSETGKERCTSCGICAKVCPPQCIWIVRGKDPNTGRPKPEPIEFAIDTTICMNCGSCAEFCPFDAIKMDHDYEHASFERFETLVFKKDRLLKPDTYHYQIHPSAKAREAKPKKEKESAKSE